MLDIMEMRLLSISIFHLGLVILISSIMLAPTQAQVMVHRSSNKDTIYGLKPCPHGSYQQSGGCSCDFNHSFLSSNMNNATACYLDSLRPIAGCSLSFQTSGIKTINPFVISPVWSTQGHKMCEASRKTVFITDVLIWNYGTNPLWDKTWSNDLIDRFEVVSQTPLTVKMKLDKEEQWNGLLLSLKFSCALESEECALLKFQGSRSYPISRTQSLTELINTTNTETTATPVQTATLQESSDLPTTGNSSLTPSNVREPEAIKNENGVSLWLITTVACVGGLLLLAIILVTTLIVLRKRRLKSSDESDQHSREGDRASVDYESISSRPHSRGQHYAPINPQANSHMPLYHSLSNETVSTGNKSSESCPVYREIESEYDTIEPIPHPRKPPRLEYNNQAYAESDELFLNPATLNSKSNSLPAIKPIPAKRPQLPFNQAVQQGSKEVLPRSSDDPTLNRPQLAPRSKTMPSTQPATQSNNTSDEGSIFGNTETAMQQRIAAWNRVASE